MTAALDALARYDDGLALPGDAVLLAVFEEHCQQGAFVPPMLCPHGNGEDCNTCYLDEDTWLRRLEDQ